MEYIRRPQSLQPPHLLACGVALIWAVGYLLFARGELGIHVETHQTILIAAGAIMGVAFGWLRLPRQPWVLVVLVVLPMVMRQRLTDTLVMEIGFLVAWQSSAGNLARQISWRRGILSALTTMAVLATVGAILGTLTTRPEQPNGALFGGLWFFGHVNMTAMWVGVTWALQLGLAIQQMRTPATRTDAVNHILIRSLLVISLHVCVWVMAAILNWSYLRSALSWTWLGGLALLAGWPSARRSGLVSLLVCSCCAVLVATFFDRGQVLLSVGAMSICGLIGVNFQRRRLLALFVAAITLVFVFQISTFTIFRVEKSAHLDHWALATSAFLQKPAWGWGDCGLGPASWACDEMRSVMHLSLDATPSHAHSIVLHLLARSGILGLSSYLGLVLAGVWSLMRSQHTMRWPLLWGLAYFHLAGSVSSVSATVPGLLLWGGLLGGLCASVARPSLQWASTTLHRGLRIAICGLLAIALISRSYWEDHVARHPHDFLSTQTVASRLGDPLRPVASLSTRANAKDERDLLRWRTAWTFHTNNTTFKTILAMTQKLDSEIMRLRDGQRFMNATGIAPRKSKSLPTRELAFAQSAAAPATKLTQRETAFLEQVDIAIKGNFFTVLPEQLQQLSTSLQEMGAAKVLGGLWAIHSPLTVRRAVCVLAGWHVPEWEQVEPLLKSSYAPGTLPMAVILYQAYQKTGDHVASESIARWVNVQLKEWLRLRHVLLSDWADRIPRRQGYLFAANASLHHGLHTSQPHIIEQAMHTLVRHIQWAPLEFRWRVLEQYRALAQASPETLAEVLQDYPEEIQALVLAACHVEYPSLEQARRLSIRQWSNPLEAALAIITATHYQQTDAQVLKSARARFLDDDRFGRAEPLNIHLFWMRRDWQVQARQ